MKHVKTMASLFNEIEQFVPPISGLFYIPNYITHSQEQKLIEKIDQQPWSQELKRRVQHYGYKYDYKARKIMPELKIDPVPEWLKICEVSRMDGGNLALPLFDQAIVNEYLPGQGISPHIDCIPCFENVICSLSLLSSCIMIFEKNEVNHNMVLEPQSLLILKDEARYEWSHSIPVRKSNIESRRVSVTFRKVRV